MSATAHPPLRRRHTTLVVAAWAAAAVSVALLASRLWTPTELDRLDFVIYHQAARELGGHALYTFLAPVYPLGFTYPPLAAVLLWPLGLLPLVTAERVWLLATIAATAAFLTIAVRMLPMAKPPRWLTPVAIAIGVWTVPSYLTTRLGQVNAFLALAVLADVAWARRRGRAAGVATGLAAAVKITPLAGAAYFAASGRWRACLVAVTTFVAATLASALVAPGAVSDYWTRVLFDTDRIGRVGSTYNNSLHRLVGLLPGAGVGHGGLWLVGVVLLAVVAWRRAARAHAVGNELAGITIVMCAAAACTPISWSHHLYFLLPPVLLLVARPTPGRLLAAGLVLWSLLDVGVDPGQWPVSTLARAVLLVAVVVALPLDAAPPSTGQAPPGRAAPEGHRTGVDARPGVRPGRRS